MRILFLAAALALLAPTAAFAMGMGPPLGVPARPDAPPARPFAGRPPVLDISLPGIPQHARIPTVLPMSLDFSRPPFGPPRGIPDLGEFLDLPPEAAWALALARPFGDRCGKRFRRPPATVPEPSTASLLALGLTGIAAARRRAAAR